MIKIFLCCWLMYSLPALRVSAQQFKTVIPLWQQGAPGFENRKDEPEQAKDWWVKNIHNPSLTVHLPSSETATRAAVIICPGGGHSALVFNAEGEEAAAYFNSLGVAAFVLKYRLFREEGSPYQQIHAVQDGQRAMRLVRSMATTYHLDTTSIGIMGFSAGGELASWVGLGTQPETLVLKDSIDQQKPTADFMVLVYPGPLAVPEGQVKNTPPLLMVAANDDECCSEPVVQLLQLYRKEHAKVELHLYAQGQHAFNMGKRSNLQTIKTWPQRMADWLADNGFLHL